MLQGRAIYDNAIDVETQGMQVGIDAVGRLRHRSIEMQRTVEGLVEARDQSRGESVVFRRGEETAMSAARETLERGDPSVHLLRH